MKSKLKIAIIITSILIIIIGSLYFFIDNEIGDRIVKDLEKVKIGYKATSHYLSVFVAKEKGFFEEQGLDAEIVEFQSSDHVLTGVLTGNLDAGRGALIKQFTIELKQPGTLKTFLVNKQTKDNFIDSFVIPIDSKIKSVSELKGKIIGTNEGSIESSFIRSIFKRFGLDEDDYELITMKPDLLPQALQSGQIDAFFSYEPVTTIAIKKKFGKFLLEAPIEKYIMDPFVSGGVFIRSDYIKKNPEKANKIIRAFYKAAEFIENNPEECKKIIAKYTPLEEDMISELHIIGEYKPSLMQEAIQEHADVMYKEGIIEEQLDVSAILYEI